MKREGEKEQIKEGATGFGLLRLCSLLQDLIEKKRERERERESVLCGTHQGTVKNVDHKPLLLLLLLRFQGCFETVFKIYAN